MFKGRKLVSKNKEILIPNNWRPREDQMALWGYLECGGKRAFCMAHRRWGKDDVGLHFTATQLCQRPGNYWHMLPEYGQARKSIWTAINPRTGKRRIDEAFPVEIREYTKEQEMIIKVKPTGSTWQLVGSDNYNCYSEDTEILTEDGWKLFSDLKKGDMVSTLGEEDVMSYSPINAIIKHDYTGEMYHVENNAIDILTTPNHKFYVQSGKGFRKFKRIDDPTILRYKIPATSKWKGKRQDKFKLPKIIDIHPCTNGRHNWNLEFDMKDWCAFMGIFLSEGSTFSDNRGNYRVVISQKKKDGVEGILRLLSRMGIKAKYHERSSNIYIMNKQLFKYMKQFGTCEKKFVPMELKKLHTDYLSILVDWMVFGDGHITKGDTLSYATTSKILADDFQELMIKLGYSGNIATINNNRGGMINGRAIKSKKPLYVYHRRKSHFKYFRDTHESYVSIIPYSGEVWCVDAGSHVIKVRRNGKEAWCGNSLIGSPPIGVVFSEWAVASPLAWPYIQPILEENNGWALFCTTPRGNNHAKKMLDFAVMDENWFGQKITADESPVFTKDQLTNIRRELIAQWGEEYGDALFMQEYYCSTEGAQLGAYFSKQISQARKDKRITNVPWQPGLEVDTFWDLGVDDSMTTWFIQTCGQEFHVIDYYENMGYGLEHYAKILKDKPYVYGNHYMPHDANAREMTNNEIALSRREVAENLGIKPIIVVSRVRNMDILVQVQIPAVRNILGQCWFDEKKCFNGIAALEGYSAEYDEEKKKLGNRPRHDWCSHGASSFITFAIGYQAKTMRRSVTSIMSERFVMDYA